MSTIQIRNLPEDVTETYRRRAEAAGQSLQAYMRQVLVAGARRRTKAEVMAALESALTVAATPGVSHRTIDAGRRELRAE